MRTRKKGGTEVVSNRLTMLASAVRASPRQLQMPCSHGLNGVRQNENKEKKEVLRLSQTVSRLRRQRCARLLDSFKCRALTG